MLGASSVFSDEVFNSRQDAPVSAPVNCSTVFNFPPSHPNQMLHPGLGVRAENVSQPLSQSEIENLIEDKAYEFSLKVIQDQRSKMASVNYNFCKIFNILGRLSINFNFQKLFQNYLLSSFSKC